MSTTTDELDLAELESLRTAHDQIKAQIASQIVGQDEVVEQLLMAVFARGHCILEGVPGLAKTLMVHSLAQSLALDFSRIQFTPDLMPSDITGTEVIQEDKATGVRQFKFLRGPVSTGWMSSWMIVVVRRAISNSSRKLGYLTNTLNMKRSCWASGRG